MNLLKQKKLWLVLAICMCVYLKIYKFDRYFIYSKNDEICVTYFIDGNFVYLIPYKYWGLGNPKKNYMKFDRSNYSEEMNILIFYKTKKYPFVIEYESGNLVENKLKKDYYYYYFKNDEVFNNPYLNEIQFGKNLKNIEITSSYIRDNNLFWTALNKIF